MNPVILRYFFIEMRSLLFIGGLNIAQYRRFSSMQATIAVFSHYASPRRVISLDRKPPRRSGQRVRTQIQESARTFLIPSAVRPKMLSQMIPTCNLSGTVRMGSMSNTSNQFMACNHRSWEFTRRRWEKRLRTSTSRTQ